MAAVMPAIKHVDGQQVFGQAAFKVKAAAAVPERKVQKMVKKNEANTMASAGRTETMIPQDNRREAVEVLDFLRILEDGEKKDMLNVLQGIRIGIQIGREMEAGTAVAG